MDNSIGNGKRWSQEKTRRFPRRGNLLSTLGLALPRFRSESMPARPRDAFPRDSTLTIFYKRLTLMRNYFA